MRHPTAIISPSATIGANADIGPFTIIHGNTIIGDNAVIGSHCEIGLPTELADGLPLVIGNDALIRSHSVFYQGSTFGDHLTTGHRVTIREKTHAGEAFQIGTLGDIQGHCQIGNYVWIFPYVVLTNDPHPPSNVLMGVTIEDYVAIATMSIILPGVTVKSGALVGAHSSVSRDVAAETVVAGTPARFVCEASAIKLKDGSGRSAYPWRYHFHRGYPESVVAQWLAEISPT